MAAKLFRNGGSSDFRSGHTFARVGEGHQQQRHADYAVQRHGQGESKLLVASSEQIDQRQREHAGEDDADLSADITECVGLDSFLCIGGEIRQNGGYRRGYGHRHKIHQNVGDVHVDHLAHSAEIGNREGHDSDYGEGEREPQEPRAHLAPLRMGFVNERADDRTGHCVKDANHKEQHADRQQADAGNIGVVEHHERGDDAEHEIVGAVRGTIAEFLPQGELDIRVVHMT